MAKHSFDDDRDADGARTGRRPTRAVRLAAVALLAFAPAAAASYGQMRFGCIPPAFAALIGIVLAAVPAAACVVLELVFSRRAPPLAVSATSALLAAAGLVAVAAAGLEKLGLAMLVLPVLAVLALLGFARNSLHRAALGSVFTLAILALVLQRFELLDTSCGYTASHTGFVAAAATIVLPWLATLLRRQRAELREDARTFVPAALAREAGSLSSEAVRAAFWRNPLTYLAGGTALAIVVVAGLAEIGWPHAWYGLLTVEATARDFLGLPQPAATSWWSPRLALWGLVFGAGLWAVASYMGKVDAGRWAPLRLLWVVAALAALAVAWHAGQRRASIEAAERAASGIR